MTYVPMLDTTKTQKPAVPIPTAGQASPAALEPMALVFLALQIPVAILAKNVPFFATAYSLALLVLGLTWGLRRTDPTYLICITAYMAGAEPLWRLGKATVFWEFGKYAIGLLLILALLRHGRFARSSKLVLIYFLLLVPSILVMKSFDREAVSFNLSGPFLLAVATMYFSTVRLESDQVLKVLLCLLAPIVGAGYLASAGTLAYEQIAFAASTKATSAGYGPNQMASILGLGALCCFLITFIYRDLKLLPKLMVVVALWMGTQSALTYSRGGFFTFGITIIAAAFFLFRDRKYRGYLIGGAAIIAVIAAFVILPWLESFTMGTLARRMKDLDTTGREEIVKSDWVVFKENPVLGVGPGQADKYHALFFRVSHAHTEFSRMLAEHGSLGLAALAVLAFLATMRLLAKTGDRDKAMTIAFTVWALLFMSHAAMRLAVAPYLFGLGAIAIGGGPERKPKPAEPMPEPPVRRRPPFERRKGWFD
jgi:O-antigen ligase